MKFKIEQIVNVIPGFFNSTLTTDILAVVVSVNPIVFYLAQNLFYEKKKDNMDSVRKNNHPIELETRSLISKRYKTITKAVNGDFWNTNSEIAHSRYVGSYGRGTAINVSDLDVLIELPNTEYNHFASLSGNGQSRLLQAVKKAIQDTYPKTDVRGDGQVVVVAFSDGMRFEILPAFKHFNYWGVWDNTYIYPDTNMGGNWLSTNPQSEQDAMAKINGYSYSNGLLFDTCKHIRAVRAEYYSSYHLSGILVDSFVFSAIKDWHWLRDGEQGGCNSMSFEQSLLNHYYNSSCSSIYAPGSLQRIDADESWDVLGKVLTKMAI